jgi:hypothetical protein
MCQLQVIQGWRLHQNKRKTPVYWAYLADNWLADRLSGPHLATNPPGLLARWLAQGAIGHGVNDLAPD